MIVLIAQYTKPIEVAMELLISRLEDGEMYLGAGSESLNRLLPSFTFLLVYRVISGVVCLSFDATALDDDFTI